jgi:mannose-6-phosphate isomerase
MQGLTPFRLAPYFRTRIWGFNDLSPWFDYKTDGEPIGEVWLTGEMCAAETGPLQGQSLKDITAVHGEALLGKGRAGEEFPLLIKILFPKEKLSVQVHPDDAMAQKYGEPRGKTECWYALSADPGACVALGLKPGVTLDQVRAGIHDGGLEDDLQTVPVAAGDVIFVDAGTVHAIWPGSILLETQQNSDRTYRMYDYGRPRELHIEKSLEATRLVTRAGKVSPRSMRDRSVLIEVEYFRVERIAVKGSRENSSLLGEDETMPGLAYLFAAAGSARIVPGNSPAGFEPFEIPAHGIACVPATSPSFTVEDLGGLDLIRISPRSPESAA